MTVYEFFLINAPSIGQPKIRKGSESRPRTSCRNLLYTGVTRGKQLVVLVGQKKAIAIAVRNVSGRRRWSKLNEWLATTSALGTTTALCAKPPSYRELLPMERTKNDQHALRQRASTLQRGRAGG